MSECSISNLGSCIMESFSNFLIDLLNLPIKPLLEGIKNLLIQPVNINLFLEIWSIIIYILSLFYGLLLLFIGFQFIVSGSSPEKRENSKTNLANIVIMMVLIQASFLLYELVLEIVSSLTLTIFSLIPSDFFLMINNNLIGLELQIVLLIPYIMTLVLTLILLSLRYILVGMGVILLAIGIFLYFLEPLKNYGKLILNFLGVLIVLPFFYSIILLASSKFLEVNIFSNLKILVMIGGFSLLNISSLILILFVIIKSALAVKTPIKEIKSTFSN